MVESSFQALGRTADAAYGESVVACAGVVLAGGRSSRMGKSGDPHAVRAATEGAAAVPVGLTSGRNVITALNSDQSTLDGATPLAASDPLFRALR